MTRSTIPAAPRTLGQWIRRYRLRRRQLHTGLPWAQEDLAVAISSDKSHVNRIERDHSVPTLHTIERICEGLALSWPERSQLLALAGYLSEPPEASPQEVQRMIEYAEPILRAGAYPLCLLDREYRVWNLNNSHAYTWLGFPDRDAALRVVRGLRTIDMLLDPRISEWWQRITVDFDVFVRRQLIRLVRNYRSRPPSTDMDITMGRVRAHTIYAHMLREVMAVPEGDPGLPFLDHQAIAVDHPDLGRYSMWIWHSSLAIDERFFISHHIPTDPGSQALLEHVAIQLAQREAQRTDPREARATT